MIHIRVDGEIENSKRKFVCGIGPTLPDGDKWIGESEFGLHHMVDCPICNGGQRRKLGTPISELCGRPGYPGYDRFTAIARSWGYD